MIGSGQIVVEKACLGNSYLLTGENFQNLLLWKLRIGEAFTLIASDDKFFRARITKLGRDAARILVFEELDGSVESYLHVTLLQAIPEKERMELIIQKTTELGGCSIIPFKSERSVSIEQRDAKQKKSHKWNEIALKAAKQSRRAVIPEIHPYCSFTDAMMMVLNDDLKLILWENEKINLLKKGIQAVKGAGVKSVSVIVGPEGGFEQAEVEAATKAGFLSVGLGKRILRTETAAIVMVGLIQYELGNLG